MERLRKTFATGAAATAERNTGSVESIEPTTGAFDPLLIAARIGGIAGARDYGGAFSKFFRACR